jgi:hypothetical protein
MYTTTKLKGEETATLEKPPNHRLFDEGKVPVSPVLQRRLEKQNEKQNPVSNNSPTINFTLGNELVSLFRPQAPPIATPTATTLPYDHVALIHPSRSPGNDVPIAEFCNTYGLGESILKKLQDNFYLHARVLRFVTIQELKDMDFRLGEIASLRDAVEVWSVLNV